MHVTFRPGTTEDIEGCLALLPDGFQCDPTLRARMPDIWRQWLGDRSMLLTVLEDADQPAGRRLAAFGNSVFITDAFAEELAAGLLPPSPAFHVMSRHLAGQSPVLSHEAVRAANSGGGLRALVLHIGWDTAGRRTEEESRIKAKLLEAFAFTHAGYQIRELLQEVYSEAEMRRGLIAGALLRTDYAGFHGGRADAPPHLRPYLMGVRREEAQEGSTIAPMFYYSPPRFFFKVGEQDMLQYALLGKNDAEQSACLHISASTVQKRWRAIYERAATVAPDLFPDEAAVGQSPQTRGGEKRRHLLAYLRHHPEELRPHLPPGRRNPTSR